VKYRSLVIIPFVALALLFLALALVPEADRDHLYRVEIELAKLAGLVGSAAAAMRFSRGDYLRMAWWLQAQCYFFIIVNDVIFRAHMGVLSQYAWAPMAGGIIVLVANIGQLVGGFMIARVWRVAGFEPAGAAWVRHAVQIGAVVIAIASAGPTTVLSFREVMHGDTASLVGLFSSFADIVSFALIAPFLLTAIGFSGGSLAWTWGLLTASLFGWLFFNATMTIGPWLVANPAMLKECIEGFRLLACMFGMTAGFAQRFAVAGVPMSRVEIAEAA
jgi:hypothetical protein